MTYFALVFVRFRTLECICDICSFLQVKLYNTELVYDPNNYCKTLPIWLTTHKIILTEWTTKLGHVTLSIVPKYFQWKNKNYPPASEASREVANYIERKNPPQVHIFVPLVWQNIDLLILRKFEQLLTLLKQVRTLIIFVNNLS